MPDAAEHLVRQVTAAVHALREQPLLKRPGVAETIDWAQALAALGADHLDPGIAAATLGAVLKYREDTQRAGGLDVGSLVARAVAGV